MSKKECIAMLLAGGQGSRLGALTSNVAKPAVSFGGKFRIIDFALSNCANSGVTTVGVLTQYRPYLLHNYIGTGGAWNLDDREGGVSILPPFATQTGGAWYEGTADAVTQNLGYIDQNDPEYVLILSGDQLYRVDYADMLATHKKNGGRHRPHPHVTRDAHAAGLPPRVHGHLYLQHGPAGPRAEGGRRRPDLRARLWQERHP